MAALGKGAQSGKISVKSSVRTYQASGGGVREGEWRCLERLRNIDSPPKPADVRHPFPKKSPLLPLLISSLMGKSGMSLILGRSECAGHLFQ